MVTAVTPVAILEATPATAPRASAAPVVQAPEPAPLLRLVIEESQPGQFVYKSVDRLTGEVVSQLPREEVLRMREDDAYQAGDIIDTEV